MCSATNLGQFRSAKSLVGQWNSKQNCVKAERCNQACVLGGNSRWRGEPWRKRAKDWSPLRQQVANTEDHFEKAIGPKYGACISYGSGSQPFFASGHLPNFKYFQGSPPDALDGQCES